MSTKVRRILAFTGIRSDYDLLSGIYQTLAKSADFEFGLIVSGAHLSSTYGSSIDAIRRDGLPVIAEIETLIDANSRSARLKALGGLLYSSIHDVVKFAPDLILFPGDREDVMAAALIGAYLDIPTAHFFGGDHATDGNVDNAVRHAASKLSSLHFVSTESHKQRLIAIGESPHRIFVVGNPALDAFREAPTISPQDLSAACGFDVGSTYAVVIYHPIMGQEKICASEYRAILESILSTKVHAVIALPNVDAGNKSILEVAHEYRDRSSLHFIKHLDRGVFVNLLRGAKFLVGNSSAGILEAPMLKLPVINVGSRQRGRTAAHNVQFVEGDATAIRTAIDHSMSKDFALSLEGMISPYGDGKSCARFVSLLRTLDFKTYLKKSEDPLLLNSKEHHV